MILRFIQLQIGFTDSRKTRRLIRAFDYVGVIYILRLWEHTAKFRPEGTLDDYSPEDIADAVAYPGDPESFANTLVDLGFLDRKKGVYSVHNWARRQPWISQQFNRSEKAKNAAFARWEKEKENRGVNATSNAHSNAKGKGKGKGKNKENLERPVDVSAANVNPGPKSKISKNGRCPVEKIVALWNSTMPEMPQVGPRAKAVRNLIRQRWREAPEQQTVENWEGFFNYIRESGFLMGRKTDFVASLEWVCRAQNFQKIISGVYNHDPLRAWLNAKIEQPDIDDDF